MALSDRFKRGQGTEAPLPFPGLRLAVETDPDTDDVGTIERGLFAFERARLGNPEHAHFAIFLRDTAGTVQAGLDGHIMWRRLFVKTLWVAEALRGQGLGSRLIQAAEAEARRRGCRSVWLTALGDRACHFYRRLGYDGFGVHADYVGSEALYSLSKTLD
jgi:GNAT superfamily N-acetyltransferase